jgi:diguanylate cyclase (GGDEF)-like protein
MWNPAVPLLRKPLPWQIALLAVAYFIAAKLSLLLAIPPGYATAVWPPSGIALAATLLLGSRIWPGVWLGAALVNYTVNSSPILAVMIGAGNALEALAGSALMQRYVGVPRRFERGRDVIVFVAIAAASCTIAATVAVLSLALAGSVSWPAFLPNWWTWWQGDVTGIIIVTPLILSWRLRRLAPWSRLKKLEGACLASLLLLFALLIFSDTTGPLSSFRPTFALLPLMIWAALRFSQRVVTTATTMVCIVAVYYTVNGIGPFALWSLNESLLVLLAFIGTIVVTTLVLSAVTTDRRRVMDALEQALVGLREQALTDPLTGLYNRRYLWEFLRREWVRAKRRELPLTAIMLDLDHFKRINDTFGHPAGDYVLVAVAGLLRNQIRSSDIVCRYGGEEFALILPETSPDSVRQRAESIRAAIKQLKLTYQGVALGSLTASLGVALFPIHADDPDALMAAADAALYAAKSAGRDRIEFSRPETALPGAATDVARS